METEVFKLTVPRISSEYPVSHNLKTPTLSTMLINSYKINMKEVAPTVHWLLIFFYLFMILTFPRIGSHLKYSELLFPLLFFSTIFYFPILKRLFGTKVLALISIFFLFVLVTNLLSFYFLNTGALYLLALPLRYIEIIVMLFAMALATYFKPKLTLLLTKYIFVFLVAYLFLNAIFNFQSGYYGLIVLPGESGPIQVGGVFGLYCIYFLWIYMIKDYRIPSNINISEVARYSLPFFVISAFIVLLNVQRTSILAVIITSILSLLIVLYIGYRRIILNNIRLVSFFLIAALSSLIAVSYHGDQLLETLTFIESRFSAFDTASETRVTRWVNFFGLDVWSTELSIFGAGLGSHNYFYGTGDFTLRFDSLPLRLYFEVGLIGAIIFFAFHFMVIRMVYKRTKVVGLFAVLLTLFLLIMSATFEAPFVYVVGSMFYAFLGIAVGLSYSRLSASNSVLKSR